MILPERVLAMGRIEFYPGSDRPDILAHPGDEVARVLALLDPGHQRDKGIDALALDIVRMATTAASATFSCATRELSTSAVPSR